jgi:transcriptional regulator with XRE-family HTH domain
MVSNNRERCYPVAVDHRSTDRSDPRRRFGRRLADLRRQRYWTQTDLAERSGINRTYISGLENGERNIGLLNLVRLAAALEVPPVELLRWEERETGSGTG